MHLKQAASTDAPVDEFAPLPPLPAGETACVSGDEGAKLRQSGCVRDEGRLCMPRNIDPKTGELGAPTPYKRGTTLVTGRGGITCAVKWQI